VTHGVQYGGTQDGHKDLYGEIHYRRPNVGGIFSDVTYWSSKGDQNFRKRRNPKPSPLIRALSTIKRPVVDPAIWRPTPLVCLLWTLQPRKNRGPRITTPNRHASAGFTGVATEKAALVALRLLANACPYLPGRTAPIDSSITTPRRPNWSR
jgi:hypothetical protein